ncbi:histidine kinase N-terminal 7TM domain-containing protein [Anaerolineales bacterium]
MIELLTQFMRVANEILQSAIVVIAASLLLYNLSRNWNNIIARTSGIVLACVTVSYTMEVFIGLAPEPFQNEVALRLQWLGIAFIPAAMFHLSDALLSTTGLPSRGRRKRIIRILYVVSTIIFILALFTDTIIIPIQTTSGFGLESGELFIIYLAYFITALIVVFINMQRAQQRSVTKGTRRRLRYLQFGIMIAPLGIFPYSVFLNVGENFSLSALILLNLANLIIVLMLIFLSYPLSFFGSDKPDRVVKTELLHMLLRGPGTGLLALGIIILTQNTVRIFSLQGEEFMPFAVVAGVLLWQWIIAIYMPYLEKQLILKEENAEQVAKLYDLNEKLLTQNDILQLLEAILEATCEYLRIRQAFVVYIRQTSKEWVQSIGIDATELNLDTPIPSLPEQYFGKQDKRVFPDFHEWNTYQILPLYSKRIGDNNIGHSLVGFLGLENHPHLKSLDQEQTQELRIFVKKIAGALDDLLLLDDIYAALEGLIPQITTTRARLNQMDYRNPQNAITSSEFLDTEEIFEQVRAALRHYWGGPGITQSRLLQLQITQQHPSYEEEAAVQTLRLVLQDAVSHQKPDGERKLTSPEWTFYNILQLRFIEGKKVRQVARQMGLSEADFYRKQRAAIEAVANTIIDMENQINATP